MNDDLLADNFRLGTAPTDDDVSRANWIIDRQSARIEALELNIISLKGAQVTHLALIEELEAKLSRAAGALDEAVYLLDPDEEDMMRQAGVYRIVTTLAQILGADPKFGGE